MEPNKNVNLHNLTIKKLKELLKKHSNLPSSPQNDSYIAHIERVIKHKKQYQINAGPTPDSIRKKIDAWKQVYRLEPDRFKRIMEGKNP